MGLAVAYLLLVGCAMVFEEHLIFVPSRYPIGDWHPVGLQCEEVAFETQDRVRLHGWYCSVPHPRCISLMAHGNAGDITHRVDRITTWQQTLHVSVFVFDYRGYGGSAGQYNELGVYHGTRAAYRWLTADKGMEGDAPLDPGGMERRKAHDSTGIAVFLLQNVRLAGHASPNAWRGE